MLPYTYITLHYKLSFFLVRATAPLECECVRRQDPEACHQVRATYHTHVVEIDSRGIEGKDSGDQAEGDTLPPGRSTDTAPDKVTETPSPSLSKFKAIQTNKYIQDKPQN